MIKQFLGHLHTINHHKWLVTRDCIRVGLISQGLKHDLSKYAPIEFLAGVKYYEGGKRSPINREKRRKRIFTGWLHHKDATAIILNIGSITLSILKMVL